MYLSDLASPRQVVAVNLVNLHSNRNKHPNVTKSDLQVISTKETQGDRKQTAYGTDAAPMNWLSVTL